MTEGAAKAMFTPLANDELTISADSHANQDREATWVPIVPAPGDRMPPDSPHHQRLGQPSSVWTYRDSADAILMLVCRFDLNQNGIASKEVLPYVYGTLDSRTGWHWKAISSDRPLYGLDRLAARPDAPVLIVEGEKAADAARDLFPDFVAITSPGGAMAAKQANWVAVRERRVVIWPDHDDRGARYAADVAELAQAAGATSVAIVDVPMWFPKKWDLADKLPEGANLDTLRQMLRAPRELDDAAPPGGRLRVVSAAELLSLDLPPLEFILEPWLPKQGIAMLYAERGCGKTHVALGIAYAVASGGRFLKWLAPNARRVVYLDGEMPAIAMRGRLAGIVGSPDTSEPPDPSYLKFISQDLQHGPMPDLATTDGQEAIDRAIGSAELVIVDNISTLCRFGKENEAEGWLPVQSWALKLRRQGTAVLFVHHANKGGGQRGTSRREDVLDTIVKLCRPLDYKPEQGARFEVRFEKTRSVLGENVAPFEAQLRLINDVTTWSITPLKEQFTEHLAALMNTGMTQRDIGAKLGISLTKVNRLAKMVRSQGLIKGGG